MPPCCFPNADNSFDTTTTTTTTTFLDTTTTPSSAADCCSSSSTLTTTIMVDPSTPSISKHDQISPPSSPIPALRKIPTDDDDCSSSSFKQSKSTTTTRLTLWKHPKETLTHFGSSVKEGILQTLLSYSLSWKQTFVSCLVITSLLVCHYTATSRSPIYQETTQLWIQCFQESFFWFGCGVLSTVGMGCGMQTGALFLFPHVVEVAVEYTQHQDQQLDLHNFFGLLWTVAIPGFWSGTGSAVGELVPFVFARLMKESGEGDPFSWILPPQQEDDEATTTNTSSSSWWNLPSVFLANTRTTMERQFVPREQSFLFWKVFVLALVPNGLFDLCGLVCGASTDISFWVFFGAVWSAKALLRTPLQTCGVAAAIVFISTSSTTDDSETGLFEEPEDTSSSSPLLATLVSFGQFVVSKFLSPQQKEEEESNLVVVFLLKQCWTVVTMVLFGFFLGSMVDQIAQQHYYHQHQNQEEEGNTTRRRRKQHQHDSIKHSSLSS